MPGRQAQVQSTCFFLLIYFLPCLHFNWIILCKRDDKDTVKMFPEHLCDWSYVGWGYALMRNVRHNALVSLRVWAHASRQQRASDAREWAKRGWKANRDGERERGDGIERKCLAVSCSTTARWKLICIWPANTFSILFFWFFFVHYSVGTVEPNGIGSGSRHVGICRNWRMHTLYCSTT